MSKKKEYIFSNTVLITEETSVMANSYEEAEDIFVVEVVIQMKLILMEVTGNVY